MSRLATLTNHLTSAGKDLTIDQMTYNSASQLTGERRTGDAYAFGGYADESNAYTQNGLNQQVTVAGAAMGWDARGNLTGDATSGKAYGYSSEKLLTSASGGVTLAYDPAMRLGSVATASATTGFAYDGADAIAEYDGAGALQRRYVFDPTTGQPVIWYEGGGVLAANRRFLSQDERGSVISVSDSNGASLGINSYDEYGRPGATNLGLYQYTGQKWLGTAGLYDYKARDYLPHLGIFAQTDPIGPIDDPNLYAYALDDPVNLVDPSGLAITITGVRIYPCLVTGICYTGENPFAPLPVQLDPPKISKSSAKSSPKRHAKKKAGICTSRDYIRGQKSEECWYIRQNRGIINSCLWWTPGDIFRLHDRGGRRFSSASNSLFGY